MDTPEKLQFLGSGSFVIGDRDACGALRVAPERVQARAIPGIYRAAVPGKGRIALLRVLMTNACRFDCRYCAINCHRDLQRSAFQPEELARLFMELYRRRSVEGLFLTSGVGGDPEKVQARMLDAVSILREKEGFRGYVHLKIMPGVRPEYVEWAVGLADRLSINLEAPSRERLALIAPKKAAVSEALATMETVRRIKNQTPGLLSGGQTTQLVVGAAGESDQEILERSSSLYGHMKLRRVYYSGYHPVCGEELAPPAPPAREHRLYQADWLLRRYPIPFDEMTFDDRGNLPLGADPKLVWAMRHPERFPIEVNRASYRELLQAPGVGPLGAHRIVELRRTRAFREPSELQAIGVVTKRARHFLLLDGRYFGGEAVMHSQLRLFDEPDQPEPVVSSAP